jgi:ribosomal protein S18 acetylase RimI-like enzyme
LWSLTPKMAARFDIRPAVPSDAAKIASIHLAAFDVNPLLHAQFPTPASLAGLQTMLARGAMQAIMDPSLGTVFIVATEIETEEVVCFAKWQRPSQESSPHHAEGLQWPEGAKVELLDAYGVMVEEAQDRVIGQEPCWSMFSLFLRFLWLCSIVIRSRTLLRIIALKFICTDPAHQRRGAGSLLTEWGIKRARDDDKRLYLESTVEARSMYEKLGFKAVESLSMALPGGLTYREICMVNGRCTNDIQGV